MNINSDKAGMGSGGAVDRTLAMLELLAAAEEPVRLSDLAQRLGMPKSTAHRILTTLVENDWAQQSNVSDCYELTIHMALIGQKQLDRLEIVDLKQPILDDLAARTRELVRLTAVQNGSLVWIGSARGRRSGIVYEPDMSEKIIPYATANGKIWLSSLKREDAIRIALEAGLGQPGPPGVKAISTIEALSRELDRTAERGYGRAHEEAEEGVGAIALAIEFGGRVVGTVSIAAPVNRLSDGRVTELLPLLRRAAEKMQLAWRNGRT